MRRGTLASLLAVLLVLMLAALVAGCGSDDDGDDDDGVTKQAKTANEDRGEDHAEEATLVPEPVPEGELPPIRITSPTPLSYVSDSFVLTGSARVVEGELRWAILDARLEPMAQGRMTATCGAPCRGSFRTRIPLSNVAIGSWELHVWTPPVDDDDPDRLHDTMVPITVTDEPVEGTPDAGAEPPGGVPRG